MDKILISLYVPGIYESYDLFVPCNYQIGKLIALIIEGITELSGGKYKSSGTELLCLHNPDVLLSPYNTLNDYRIKDGDKLILF